MINHWHQLYGLSSVSLRLFNVYGPRSRTSGTYGAVFGVFLAQILANKPLTIVGDGTQTRDFTFVSDVVRAFILAANSPASGAVFNIGTSEPIAVNRLVKALGVNDVVHTKATWRAGLYFGGLLSCCFHTRLAASGCLRGWCANYA